MVIADTQQQTSSPLPSELHGLYPFAHHYCVLPEGERLHYIDEGKGDVVLMLHGNPTWSFMYRDLVRALVEAGYRCIVPDHVGMGLSDKPQKYPYTLERHTRNVQILLEQLGVRHFNLVAHDWGGAIGMGLATAKTDLVGRIVMMNTAAFLGGRIPRRIDVCRTPVLGALLIRGLNAFAAGATRMATAKGLPSLVREGFIFPYRNWRDRIATLRFVEDIPLLPDHVSYKVLARTEARLPLLDDKPLFLAWGVRDWCFDMRFLERWREIFPKARCSAFADAGHYILEDAGDRVIPQIVDFMQGRPASLTRPGDYGF